MMRLGVAASMLWIVGIYANASRADSALDLKAELSRPVLAPETALVKGGQTYVEARIPRVPDFKTAAEFSGAAEKWRKDVLEQVVFRGDAAKWRDHPLTIEFVGEASPEPGYLLKKLRYEILPGMWIPALLYEPMALSTAAKTHKVPVVLNVNGHDSKGKAADYKQTRCINLAKRGMLVLNVEWFGMGQLRVDGNSHVRMNQLDLCGSSGIAPFYLAMSKGIDVLLKLPHADSARVAVSGLSGGGWQTIFISGLDTRVTLANPVAGYSSYLTRTRHFSDLGDSEQTPCDLGKYVDYAHLTAMRAPRATLLTFNAHDNCCFAAGHALPPLLAACRPVYTLFGETDRLVSHVNHVPGDHNFGQDNREAFYRAVGAFFFDGAKDFDAKEIANQAGEVKSSEDLLVPVASDNATFSSLAKSLAYKLPRASEPPKNSAMRQDWQTQRRKLLAEIVAAKDYAVTAEEVKAADAGQTGATPTTHVRRWRLNLSDIWTVPAVELSRGDSKGTTILVADAGRAAIADEVETLLTAGQRVLAVDPFYFGESKLGSKDWLFGLMVATIGDRELGLQASQLAAIARWAHDSDRTGGTVTLQSVGPRSSVFTLVAAALESQAVGGVRTKQPMASLKEHVFDGNLGVSQAPELFCFGLLEHFDVPQLQALIAPRAVEAK